FESTNLRVKNCSVTILGFSPKPHPLTLIQFPTEYK
ncbi:hypothetical protein LINPERHAP1_LOCUS10317, partial [Linum perenne]